MSYKDTEGKKNRCPNFQKYKTYGNKKKEVMHKSNYLTWLKELFGKRGSVCVCDYFMLVFKNVFSLTKKIFFLVKLLKNCDSKQ